jgi:hypothetical protein
LEEFVSYWEEFYDDSKKRPDREFLRRLKWNGGKLTAEDVEWLFRWKYRNVPSWSPKKTIRQLSRLNGLRFGDDKSVMDLAKSLSPSGQVKRFFICHIVSPLKYPIWDQYVLKAHLVISRRENQLSALETLIKSEQAYEFYRRDFNDLVRNVPARIRNDGEFPPFRRLDRALWAMGKHCSLLIHSPQAAIERT